MATAILTSLGLALVGAGVGMAHAHAAGRKV